MKAFFYNHNVTFEMWNNIHLLTIGIIIILLYSLFHHRKHLYPHRDKIRIMIGVALILSRISLDIWYISTGSWDIRTSLPLELCSIASLACGLMLLTKSHLLFEIVYFIGIAGAIQAIITPELMFGFPQFRFFQFFLDHFLLISGPLVMIWLYNYTISIRSMFKAFIALNGIAMIVFLINLVFDANYMFLRHKPTSTSLLDFLGPYPFYIIMLEFIAILLFYLMYLPFHLHKRQKQ